MELKPMVCRGRVIRGGYLRGYLRGVGVIAPGVFMLWYRVTCQAETC